jgi:hypothetical protein
MCIHAGAQSVPVWLGRLHLQCTLELWLQ